MDNSGIDHLLEALGGRYEKVDHPVSADTATGRHDFNWLDAAPRDQVLELAERVILTCARIMSIRAAALREEWFASFGYTGHMPVNRDLTSQDILQEAEWHEAFYLKLRSRLTGLEHLDSINNRTQTVLRFPGADVTSTAEEGKPEPRPLDEEYELLRRTHIATGEPIIAKSWTYYRDFLAHATVEQLEESTDAILLATAARMAVRASLRLEKAWRQEEICYGETVEKSAPVSVMIEERDRYVDSYLKIREDLAKAAHKQSIAERASGPALRKPRRPRLRVKKAATA